MKQSQTNSTTPRNKVTVGQPVSFADVARRLRKRLLSATPQNTEALTLLDEVEVMMYETEPTNPKPFLYGTNLKTMEEVSMRIDAYTADAAKLKEIWLTHKPSCNSWTTPPYTTRQTPCNCGLTTTPD